MVHGTTVGFRIERAGQDFNGASSREQDPRLFRDRLDEVLQSGFSHTIPEKGGCGGEGGCVFFFGGKGGARRAFVVIPSS